MMAFKTINNNHPKLDTDLITNIFDFRYKINYCGLYQ